MIATAASDLLGHRTSSPSTEFGDQSQSQQQGASQSRPSSSTSGGGGGGGAGSVDLTEYTIADVYEDAAVIGSELERIISNYGAHVLKELMPKVIAVLELLEQLTLRKERDIEQINECRLKIASLEMDKMQRFNEREKYEKELEEIEEKWKQETLKLIGMVNKLKEENKRMNDTINQNNFIMKNDHITIKQEELDYIRQIKEENIKLKETTRYKDREIEQKNEENEALQSQIERLTSTMLNLRRKQILAQNQIEKMVKAKAELECALTEKEHELNLIKEKLHMRSRNEQDEEDNNSEFTASAASSKKAATMTEQQQKEASGVDSKESLASMLIFDAKDPNRPRFTLKELQKVLMEKNELTIKLDQTQDELEQLRKNRESLHWGDVQGPINREPDDKLDPSLKQQQAQSSSGIRRLYVVDSNNLIVVVIDYYFIITPSSSSSLLLTKPASTYAAEAEEAHSSCTQASQPLESPQPLSAPNITTTSTINNNNNNLKDEDDGKRKLNVNTLCLCVLLFNLYYSMFICFNVACVPKFLLTSLVCFLRHRPSSSLLFFLSCLLVVLLNDVKFLLVSRSKSTKSSSSSSSSFKRRHLRRRHSLIYPTTRSKPQPHPPSSSQSTTATLKDSRSNHLDLAGVT